MKSVAKARLTFFAVFFALLVIEVLIALFVRDDIIRPYGGDVLVTVLLCALVRTVRPDGIKALPIYVFIFAVFVEFAQYIHIVELVGLSHITFFRILMGNSFSVIDILCYGLGCLLFFLTESGIKSIFGKN